MISRNFSVVALTAVLQLLLIAQLLTSCSSKSQENMHIDILHSNLAKAQALEGENSQEAMTIYKQLASVIVDSAMYSNTAPIVYAALDGIAGSASAPDAAEEALDWLKQLSDHPTGLIQTCAKRDLNSTIAALNYQLGDMAAAAQHMQRAIEDSLHYPTPERQFRDNLRGAQIFMPVDDTPERVIGCLEAAERNALECEAMPSQMSFVRSFLGTLYNWQGNIERAFEVLNDNLAQTNHSRPRHYWADLRLQCAQQHLLILGAVQ